ncbi:MAG TPA: HAMP domain-containing histidine kinase [Gammaproteobacteria bacterium]|nr:HAMP domain-containing histidine kinase [Gammaproteobacteria bacterium]
MCDLHSHAVAMSDTSTIHHHTSQDNLHRLAILRGLGIAIQALLIAIAQWWLGLALPILPLAFILTIHGLWAVFTAWRAQQRRDVSNNEFTLQLTTDILAFSGVLYFVGGATNPFAWFYLLPLTIAATLLNRAQTWGLAALTVICYSLLMRYHLPFSLDNTGHNGNFSQHVFGMWFGFVMSAGLVAYFVTGMAEGLRARDHRLAEAREQALRDEQVVALGTLAAGAAHELGTPLNTMAIINDELKEDFPPQKDHKLNQQLSMISEQIDRCKAALSVISASAGELRADAGEALPVEPYLQNLLSRWHAERPETQLQKTIHGSQPIPFLIADLALDQAIINILNNAADVSPEWVAFHASWTPQQLNIEIRDHGPGLSQYAEPRIGKIPCSDKDHGLGLGLYLAHSVIERMGGNVQLFNDRQGSCALIQLPLLENPA